MRRGFHAIAVPLRRYDGVTIAAASVAAWVEDSSTGTFVEKYLDVLREETEVLTPQLL
jgi:IclR family pca regulon transcriptional regulator